MITTEVRAALLATTAVLTLIASAHAAGPNIVLDPGFETGAPWTFGASLTSRSSTNPQTGSWALNGGCVGGGCVVVHPTSGLTGSGVSSQTLLNVQPGVYRGQFAFQSAGFTLPSSLNQVAVSVGDNTPFNQSNIAAGGYQTFRFISALSGGTESLRIGIRQDPGFSNVDNVSLRLVDDGRGNNIAAAAQTVAVQASRDFLDRLQGRFNRAGSPITTASVRDTYVASADGATYVNAGGRYRAFMSVFGSDGEWDDSRTSADRRGLSAGFEFAAAHGLDLGVAFALSQTNFRTRTGFTANHGEADEYLGAIYAHWSADSVPLYVNLIGGYGQSSTDFNRLSLDQVLYSGGAEARNVDTSQWFLSAEAGWDWAVSSRLTLTPFGRVDAAWLDQDGYRERATGDFIAATVGGRDFDSVRTILGARAEVDLNLGNHGSKIGGKVGWAHEFERDRVVAFSETTGPETFGGFVRAARPDKDSVVAGANVEVGVSDEASLYVGYNGAYGDTQEVHAGEVGLRVTW